MPSDLVVLQPMNLRFCVDQVICAQSSPSLAHPMCSYLTLLKAASLWWEYKCSIGVNRAHLFESQGARSRSSGGHRARMLALPRDVRFERLRPDLKFIGGYRDYGSLFAVLTEKTVRYSQSFDLTVTFPDT